MKTAKHRKEVKNGGGKEFEMVVEEGLKRTVVSETGTRGRKDRHEGDGMSVGKIGVREDALITELWVGVREDSWWEGEYW